FASDCVSLMRSWPSLRPLVICSVGRDPVCGRLCFPHAVDNQFAPACHSLIRSIISLRPLVIPSTGRYSICGRLSPAHAVDNQFAAACHPLNRSQKQKIHPNPKKQKKTKPRKVLSL